MKVIIIEDEKPAARRLDRMVKEIGFNPAAMLHSVKNQLIGFIIMSTPI